MESINQDNTIVTNNNLHQDIFSATTYVCENVGDLLDGFNHKSQKSLELYIYQYLLKNIGRNGRETVKDWELAKMAFLIMKKDMHIDDIDNMDKSLIQAIGYNISEFNLDSERIKDKIYGLTQAQKATENLEREKRQKEQKEALDKAQKIGDKLTPMVNSFYMSQSVIFSLENLFDKVGITCENIQSFEIKHSNWKKNINNEIGKLTHLTHGEGVKKSELDKVLESTSQYIANADKGFIRNVKKIFLYYINQFEKKIIQRLGEEFVDNIFPDKEKQIEIIISTNNIEVLEKKIGLLKNRIEKYFEVLDIEHKKKSLRKKKK